MNTATDVRTQQTETIRPIRETETGQARRNPADTGSAPRSKRNGGARAGVAGLVVATVAFGALAWNVVGVSAAEQGKIDNHCAETHLDFITITGSDVLGPTDQFCEIDLALPDPTELVDVADIPQEFADLATWAVGLFEEAGLHLPPIRFVYHGDDRGPCGGWRGVHRHVEGNSTIGICSSDSGNVTAANILHETAHAWAAHDLSDERKADFQLLRGWAHWRNYEAAEWHENGAEQAAEMIVWGLIDRPVGIITINDHSCEDLDAGYRVLTGQPPLHGYREYC